MSRRICSRAILLLNTMSAPARSIWEGIRSRLSPICIIGAGAPFMASYMETSILLSSVKLLVRFACGSTSTSRTLRPILERAAATLTQLVVFATPPLWFATAIILAMSRQSVCQVPPLPPTGQ